MFSLNIISVGHHDMVGWEPIQVDMVGTLNPCYI